MQVTLLDKFGYVKAEVDIPLPIPTVLVWGLAVYLASGDHYQEVNYYIIPDTPDSGVH